MLEVSNSSPFKKIGTLFQLSKKSKDENKEDIFFNKKKEEQFKKSILIKALFSILLTNTLTFMITSNPQYKEIQRINTDGMTMVSIALDSYVPLTTSNEKVKLIGPNNETISNEAIIESITDKQAYLNDKEIPVYIIQIKNEDARKLVQYQEKVIRAYPASIKDFTETKSGGPYEIKF